MNTGTAGRHLVVVCGLLLWLLVAPAAPASELPQSFTAGSFAEIAAAHAGKPFLVSAWSVSCPHCPAELRALAELHRQHPELDIVLIATDTPDDAETAAQLVRDYGLANAGQWIFADYVPDRLRMSIDRRWHGELPRTWFFDRTHRVEARSGVIPAPQLAQRAKEMLR